MLRDRAIHTLSLWVLALSLPLAAVTYIYQLIFSIHNFSRYGRQNSTFDLSIYAIVAMCALGFFVVRTRTPRLYLLAIMLGIWFLDPNPAWNNTFWWRLYSSPHLDLFMLVFAPLFFCTHITEIRKRLASSILFWFPLFFFVVCFFRFHLSADFGVIHAVAARTDPFEWLTLHPNATGLVTLVSSFYAMTAFFAFRAFLAKDPPKPSALLPLAISATVAAAILLTVYFFGKNLMLTAGEFYRLWGFRVGPNHLGLKSLLFLILLSAIEVSTPPWKRRLSWISRPLFVVIIVLTLSRSTLLALLAVLAFSLAARTKTAFLRTLIAIALIVGTLGSLSLVYKTNYVSRFTALMTAAEEKNYDPVFSRPALYRWGISAVAAHPLAGVGYNWQRIYLEHPITDMYTVARLPHLRSYYLDLAVTGGLPQLVAFLAFMLVLGYWGWRRRNDGGYFTIALAIAIATHSLFDSVLLEPGCMLFFYACLAILSALAQKTPQRAHKIA